MEWTEGKPRPLLYTPEDVWQMFEWSQSTFYRHIREGKFPRPTRVGNDWRYTKADIDAYLLLAGRWFPGAFEGEEGAEKPAKGGRKNAEEDGAEKS